MPSIGPRERHNDHPFADIRNGQAFVNLVNAAVTRAVRASLHSGRSDETDEVWLPLLHMAADFGWPVYIPVGV